MNTETGKTPEQNLPWWKKIIASLQKLFRNLLAIFYKPSVPENMILEYSHAVAQNANIARVAKALDNERFSNKDFLFFLRINAQLEGNMGEYQGLNNSIQSLRLALETKDSFLKIEQTELRYTGFVQNEFYDFVFKCLGKQLSKEEFKKKVQEKMFELIPKVKTEEGRAALQSYSKELDNISKEDLGLKMLYVLKQYDLGDFSLLRTAADIVTTFQDKDLQNIKEMMVIVRVNQELFDKLATIIDLPLGRREPKTYSLMIQYIALRNRYQDLFNQFQQMVILLKEWGEFYKQVIAIRQEYPPTRYKVPKSFTEEIPGESLYTKYQGYFAQE